jgi:hypothetical protein
VLDSAVCGLVVSEPPEAPFRAGPTALPVRVKAVDSHGDGVKPSFDVVSLAVVEVTAQLTTCEGSQIAHSIGEKLFRRDRVSRRGGAKMPPRGRSRVS